MWKVLSIALALSLTACGDKGTSSGNTAGSGGAAGMTAGTTAGKTAGTTAGVTAGTTAGTAGTTAGVTAGTVAGATAGVQAGVGSAGDMGGTAGIPTGTDEYVPSEHCTAGTYVTSAQFSPGSEPTQRMNCSEADYVAAGIPMGPKFPPLIVYSTTLATPMQANQPYAVSFEMSYAGVPAEGQVEVWGTQAQCGKGSTAELLYEGMPVWKRQILCLDVTPKAAYTHLLLVVRFVGDELTGSMSLDFDGATFCPTGACPSP